MADPTEAGTRALILAAGCGLRMGETTNQLPKCLLSLGDDFILQFQLRALKWAGVTQVGIVTGCQAERVRKGAEGHRVEFFHNADYAATNSLYSFYCARRFAEPGALVINCDVVFHPVLLRRLIASPYSDALLLDPHSDMGDEEMKVAVDRAGIVTRISKSMDPREAAGENLGIVKFGPGSAQKGFDLLLERQPDKLRTLWLPECINLLKDVRPFRVVTTDGLPWTEIDFPEDLQFARDDVYPKCAEALRK